MTFTPAVSIGPTYPVSTLKCPLYRSSSRICDLGGMTTSLRPCARKPSSTTRMTSPKSGMRRATSTPSRNVNSTERVGALSFVCMLPTCDGLAGIEEGCFDDLCPARASAQPLDLQFGAQGSISRIDPCITDGGLETRGIDNHRRGANLFAGTH